MRYAVNTMTTPIPYREGRQAYANGLEPADNPYLTSHGLEGFVVARRLWFDGYYDEQRYRKHGPNPDELLLPLDDCEYP